MIPRILSFLLISILCSYAQVEHQLKEIVVSSSQNYDIRLDKPITALAIEFQIEQNIEGSYVKYKNQQYSLKIQEGLTANAISELIVFPEPVKEFQIYSGKLGGNIRLKMQYVASLKGIDFSSRLAQDSCGKPIVIPVSSWRKDLPKPKESPISTKVNFVIVHHAASSNTAKNYVDVVRNIYVFHTSPPPNGNGWNDVGYNFLIAQDGSIFEGRDGQEIMEGDNVQGAHFCGKNANTMGICLLGNYMEIEPTSIALKSLEQLIAWKLSKENLPNIGQVQHNGSPLNIISGHRDGCATQCPGDFVYKKMEDIRRSVGLQCGYSKKILSVENSNQKNIVIFPNPTADFLIVKYKEPVADMAVLVVDLSGNVQSVMMELIDSTQIKVAIQDLNEGIYFLRTAQESIKFVVSK